MKIIKNPINGNFFVPKLNSFSDSSSPSSYDILIQDNEGKSSLWHACHDGNIEGVKSLLNRGALINTSDADGCTPLMISCLKGHTAIVEILLSHAANSIRINAMDAIGKTASDYAYESKKNSKAIIKLLQDFLLEKLLLSTANHQINLILQLIKQYDTIQYDTINQRIDSDSTLLTNLMILHKVYINNRFPLYFNKKENTLSSSVILQTIKYVIDNTPNDNPDHQHFSALHIDAILNDDIKITEMLISRGDNINQSNHHGITPLQIACDRKHKSQALCLISHGADLTLTDTHAKTVFDSMPFEWISDIISIISTTPNKKNNALILLIHIIQSDNTPDNLTDLLTIIQDLINIPIDANNTTLLMLAYQHKKSEIATALLQHGANSILENNKQKIADEFEKKRERLNIKDKLEKEIHVNNHEAISSLLNMNDQLLQPAFNDLFPYACQYGDFITIELFIQHNIDVNAVGEEKVYNLPLTITIKRKEPALIQLLIDNGADITDPRIDLFNLTTKDLSIALPIWHNQRQLKTLKDAQDDENIKKLSALFDIKPDESYKQLAIEIFSSLIHPRQHQVDSNSNLIINNNKIGKLFKWMLIESGLMPNQLFDMINHNNYNEQYVPLFFHELSLLYDPKIATDMANYLQFNNETRFIDDFILNMYYYNHHQSIFNNPKTMEWMIQFGSAKSHEFLMKSTRFFLPNENLFIRLLIDSGKFLNEQWLRRKIDEMNEKSITKNYFHDDDINKIKKEIIYFVAHNKDINSIEQYRENKNIFKYYLKIGIDLNLKDNQGTPIIIPVLAHLINNYCNDMADITHSSLFKRSFNSEKQITEKNRINLIKKILIKDFKIELSSVFNNTQQPNKHYYFSYIKKSFLSKNYTIDKKDGIGLKILNIASYMANYGGLLDNKCLIDIIEKTDEKIMEEVNLKEKNSTTLIMHAALANNWDLVDYLLKKRSGLFSFNIHKSTYFTKKILERLRSSSKTKELLTNDRLLLLSFADYNQELSENLFKEQQEILKNNLNKSDEIGMTLLMYACYLTNRDNIVKLIQLLKDSNQLEQALTSVDSQGTSVLSHAILADKLDIVWLLLANGANPFSCQDTAHSYQYHSDFERIFELCENVDEEEHINQLETLLTIEPKRINIKNYYNQTPFVIACLHNNQITANLLLNQGSNPLIGWTYKTLNHLTWEPTESLKEYQQHANDLFSIFESILNFGDDNYQAILPHASAINLLYPLDEKNECPLLMHAYYHNNTHLMRQLIDYGADINGVDTMGRTTLMQACLTGQYDIVNLLLQLGANINIRGSNDNETALILACQNNHTECVKLLLEYNPDIMVRTETIKKTALDFAKEKKNNAIAALIYEKEILECIIPSELFNTNYLIDNYLEKSQKNLSRQRFFSSSSSSSSSSSFSYNYEDLINFR